MGATEREAARGAGLGESLDALTTTEGILGAVLATEDGFLLAARVGREQDREGLAAAAAAIGRMANDTLRRLGRGDLEVATLEASRLTFVVRRVSVGFLLVVSDPEADMGAIAGEMGRAAASLERAAAALVGP